MSDDLYADIVEIWQDGQLGWHWHAKAGNGEILFSGEAHTTYSDAERAALAAAPGAKVKLIAAP